MRIPPLGEQDWEDEFGDLGKDTRDKRFERKEGVFNNDSGYLSSAANFQR
jgi:hypothetical protein